MTDLLDVLRRDGIVLLPRRLDMAFAQHLVGLPVYENHVRQGKPNPIPIGSHPWTSHDMWDVIAAPGLLEAAMMVRPVVEAYLESAALLYSLNAFYCEPNSHAKPDIQGWHRDTDDTRFLALFVYGTDVNDEQDGPHQFQCGTHQGRPDCHHEATILGPAGSMFLADTSAMHRGLVPQRNRRMLAWARWGVSDPPPAYQWDKLKPAPRGLIGDRYPADPDMQSAIRLVVN